MQATDEANDTMQKNKEREANSAARPRKLQLGQDPEDAFYVSSSVGSRWFASHLLKR